MTYISFTKTDLDQAIQEATVTAHTKRQQDRVAKAVAYCAKWGGDAWVLKSDTITIKSESSDDVYTLTLGDFMEHRCKSLRPCWHETLGSIVMAANQLREDREALEYGVWYPNRDCCGGQGCHLCMITVEPAVVPTRVEKVLTESFPGTKASKLLQPAIITNECADEVLAW